MRLHVLPDERFSCHQCTDCCRHWHVELMDAEVQSLPRLSWPQGDALRGVDPLLRLQGRVYLKHKPSGACIFLNETNGLCRVHEQFGASAKPAGCRLFPFQLTPTFPGQAAVLSRFDCPSVRKNAGEPVSQRRTELLALAREIGLSEGKGAKHEPPMDGLSQRALENFVGFMLEHLPKFESHNARSLFMCYAPAALRVRLANPFVPADFPGLHQTLNQAIADTLALSPVPRMTRSTKVSFRAMLSAYLRRDEDVVDSRASRWGRSLAVTMFTMGFGGAHRLGVKHPYSPVRQAGLFSRSYDLSEADGSPLWRMIRNRLETLTFFGAGNFGLGPLDGLVSLAMVPPLTLATAKLFAAGKPDAPAEGKISIDAASLELAIAAIEHGFGRSPLLGTSVMRFYDNLLGNPGAFTRLMLAL